MFYRFQLNLENDRLKMMGKSRPIAQMGRIREKTPAELNRCISIVVSGMRGIEFNINILILL